MPLIQSSFSPNKLLHNGHIQTLYPYFFRRVSKTTSKRIRLETPDQDFLDIDLLSTGSKKVIILTHGLEGSSSAGHIQGMGQHFHHFGGYDVIAWNMRSCSGEMNKTKGFYHAAGTDDLDQVVNFAIHEKGYKEVIFVSVSLGGNLTAYYLAQKANMIPSEIKGAALFSSTIHIGSTIDKLGQTAIGRFYAESFLTTMRKKVIEKSKFHNLGLDIHAVQNAKTFREFDRSVTAPLYGHKSEDDYYAEASALQYLEEIKVPTLIVQAKDDPFLGSESFPVKMAKNSKFIHLEVAPTGGHIGFMNLNKNMVEYWSEKRAFQFLETAA